MGEGRGAMERGRGKEGRGLNGGIGIDELSGGQYTCTGASGVRGGRWGRGEGRRGDGDGPGGGGGFMVAYGASVVGGGRWGEGRQWEMERGREDEVVGGWHMIKWTIS